MRTRRLTCRTLIHHRGHSTFHDNPGSGHKNRFLIYEDTCTSISDISIFDFNSQIIIIVTVTKSYSVNMKYCFEQVEKTVVLVRIIMSKSGFKDKVLIKLIVGVVKHVVTIDELGPVDY
jgi:hypothetical protein